MQRLELKIPPVAVFLLVAAVMWLLAWGFPKLAVTIPAGTLAAAGCVLAGLAAGLLGVVSFRRARTTVNPMKPDSSSALVSTGIYRITRNPMYLGLLLGLAGWALYLANAPAFLGLPAFVLYMNRFQIEPEERALAARFGPSFADYRTRVRRWI